MTASVWLPHALHRKWPNAHREFKWQFLFASDRLTRDPRDGRLHRHHLHKNTFPNNLARAVAAAGIEKKVSAHVFRHSFATHLLASGTDIRTVQDLMGHEDVSTTMIYLHVLPADRKNIVSPLDRLSRLPEEKPQDKAASEDQGVAVKEVPQVDRVSAEVGQCIVPQRESDKSVEAECADSANAVDSIFARMSRVFVGFAAKLWLVRRPASGAG